MRLLILILFFTFLSTVCQGKVYPYRWVYVSRGLRKDSDVEEIARIVKAASEHGLNGMVLAAGLDRLDLQPPDYFRRSDNDNVAKTILPNHAKNMGRGVLEISTSRYAKFESNSKPNWQASNL